LLWFVPMGSSFMTFMLLRDVYQHANADDGRLTNSRVFYTDPFTRWAVFVYGQDMHVPHHLFPAVPHYRLPELHQVLRDGHAEYAARVVECHGTLLPSRPGAPSILDELSDTTRLSLD
jgi:fatty acid desaturase